MASGLPGLLLSLTVLLVAGRRGVDGATSTTTPKMMTTTTTPPVPPPDISHLCYACRDTGDHGRCRDFKALEKAGLAFEPSDLVQNCSQDQDYCTIEEFEEHGQSIIIRGCSKRNTASFNLSEGRLVLLQPDNNTVCSYDIRNRGIKCVSLCFAPLCNGPDVLSAGSSLPWSQQLVTWCFLWTAVWYADVILSALVGAKTGIL